MLSPKTIYCIKDIAEVKTITLTPYEPITLTTIPTHYDANTKNLVHILVDNKLYKYC